MNWTHPQVAYSLMVAFVATFATTNIGLAFGWITEISLLELFAVFTSYACTYLCVMQLRMQYVFSAITTVAYVVLFYQWGLYGSALANAYIPFALIYGWYRWKDDKNPRPVSTVTSYWHYVGYLSIGAVGWVATYYICQALGFGIPVLDSAILVLTIVAQFLMDNKKLENWVVWFVLNIIAIVLYFNTGLYLAAMQYVLFLLNTLFGWYMWRKSMPVAQRLYTSTV